MTTVVGIIFLLLLILSFWRRMHQMLVDKEFRYKVFSLRDDLRKLALTGKVKTDSWIFRYLDVSFSRAINESYYLTLIRVMVLRLRYQHDPGYEEFEKKFHLALDENQELKKLLNLYYQALHSYLANQHYIGYHFFMKPAIVVLIGAHTASKKLKEGIELTLYYPDSIKKPQPFMAA